MRSIAREPRRHLPKVLTGIGVTLALMLSSFASPASGLTGTAAPAAILPQPFDTGDAGTIAVPTTSSCPTFTSPPRAFEAWFNIEDMEVRGFYDPVNDDPWDYIKKVAQVICGAAAGSEIKLSMYFMRAIGTLRSPGLHQDPDDPGDTANMGSRPESDPEMVYDALEYVAKYRKVKVGVILDGGSITPTSAKKLIVKRLSLAQVKGLRTESVKPFQTAGVEWCKKGCFNTGNSYQSRYAINHEKFLTISDTIWDTGWKPTNQTKVPASEAPEPSISAPAPAPATAPATAPGETGSPTPSEPTTSTPEPTLTPDETAAPEETGEEPADESSPTPEAGQTTETTADAELEAPSGAAGAFLGLGAAAVLPADVPQNAAAGSDGAPGSRVGAARKPVVISSSGNFARSQIRNYIQELTVVYGDYKLWQEFSHRYDAMAACAVGGVSDCKSNHFPVPLNTQLKKDKLKIWVDSSIRRTDAGRGTQVIFSPQPASVKDAYVKMFDGVDCEVDKNIRVAMFKLTDAKAEAMIKALNSLKKRGCSVKVLLTQQGGSTTISKDVVKLIKASKLNVKCTQTPMHTKVIIIGPQNNNNGRVLSGTANMSTSGLRYSEEHTLIFDARAASPQYQDDIRRVYGVYLSAWYELSKISKTCKA